MRRDVAGLRCNKVKEGGPEERNVRAREQPSLSESVKARKRKVKHSRPLDR